MAARFTNRSERVNPRGVRRQGKEWIANPPGRTAATPGTRWDPPASARERSRIAASDSKSGSALRWTELKRRAGHRWSTFARGEIQGMKARKEWYRVGVVAQVGHELREDDVRVLQVARGAHNAAPGSVWPEQKSVAREQKRDAGRIGHRSEVDNEDSSSDRTLQRENSEKIILSSARSLRLPSRKPDSSGCSNCKYIGTDHDQDPTTIRIRTERTTTIRSERGLGQTAKRIDRKHPAVTSLAASAGVEVPLPSSAARK